MKLASVVRASFERCFSVTILGGEGIEVVAKLDLFGDESPLGERTRLNQFLKGNHVKHGSSF